MEIRRGIDLLIVSPNQVDNLTNAIGKAYAKKIPVVLYDRKTNNEQFTAFMGAEILRREYGEEYPGIAIAGYTVATGVGLMRIYNNRHWASDVLAGAGIGILSASLTYWLAPYLTF